MSQDGEKHLQQSYTLFQAGDYKKSREHAEKARKRFKKEGLVARAAEALRVMADSYLNLRDLKKAEGYYGELMDLARANNLGMYRAAASWGLGEIASYHMDYDSAAKHYHEGLEEARRVASKWYIAWNSFGLAKAYRGLGRLDEIRPLLSEARDIFSSLNHTTYVEWVEKLAEEVSVDITKGQPSDMRVWLCPVCGSKYDVEMAENLSRGKKVTCQYCGTTVG